MEPKTKIYNGPMRSAFEKSSLHLVCYFLGNVRLTLAFILPTQRGLEEESTPAFPIFGIDGLKKVSGETTAPCPARNAP
jgi:hypothetical protein